MTTVLDSLTLFMWLQQDRIRRTLHGSSNNPAHDDGTESAEDDPYTRTETIRNQDDIREDMHGV